MQMSSTQVRDTSSVGEKGKSGKEVGRLGDGAGAASTSAKTKMKSSAKGKEKEKGGTKTTTTRSEERRVGKECPV